MKGPELLQANTDRLITKMGGFFPGERVVFRGHDLLTELVDMDWIEIYVFGITGRRFTPEQLRLMHAMTTLTSFPDARIWNLRVAALAGNSRSTATLGLSAALAVSEASIYGGGVFVKSIEFFKNTLKKLESGTELSDCVQNEIKIHRGIPGYGRPITSRDERNEPIMKLAATLGLDNGPHVKLAYAVDEYLLSERRRLRLNAGGLWSAFGADLGFSSREYALFMFPIFIGSMPPCYIENVERPEGTLFPLSCDHIQYEGVPKRKWCRAA